MSVKDDILKLAEQHATKPTTERPDLLVASPEDAVDIISENPDVFSGITESETDGMQVMGYFLQIDPTIHSIRLATSADYRAPSELAQSRGQFLFTKYDAKHPICLDCWAEGVVVKLKYMSEVGADKTFLCPRERKSKKFVGGLPGIGTIVHQ